MDSKDKDAEDYTKLMRKSTREIHSISDALINAKLALTTSNDKVWAEGLLIFYEIFRFLERAIRETSNPQLKKFHIEEMFRTEAFEKDLEFYLGKNWNKDYIPRKSVRRYINYLEKLERNEPELLTAYVYHLYMGLLSGGQILRKKRMLLHKVYLASDSTEGNAVTEFSVPIAELKAKIRKLTNEVCREVDEDMRDKISKEGKMVFTLNNEIVSTIESTNQVLLKKLAVSVGVVGLAILFFKYLR